MSDSNATPTSFPRFTVFGEHIADLVTQPDGDLRSHPGGSPANVAVTLARLGDHVSLAARLGPDVFGRRMRSHLVAQHVDLSHLVAAQEPSSLAVVSLDAAGVATYDFWMNGTADWQWSDDDLAEHPAPGTVALHTGSLASWTPPGSNALRRLWERAASSDAVTLSYDPNARPSLMGTADQGLRSVTPFVAASHLVKVSDEDLHFLQPGRDPLEVASEWATWGPSLVVVTRGGAGAQAIRGSSVVSVESPKISVVDTVGAGDTFSGALLHALDQHDALGSDPASRLAAVDDAMLAQVLTYAATAAAITCTRPGADPPTADEVANF